VTAQRSYEHAIEEMGAASYADFEKLAYVKLRTKPAEIRKHLGLVLSPFDREL